MRGLVACSRGPPRKRNASKIDTVLTATQIFVWTWQITLQTRPAHCSLASKFPGASVQTMPEARTKPKTRKF